MSTLAQNELDYHRIEKAIHYVNEHAKEQPQLEEVAAHVGVSPYHFQRMFSRWAGVSPKRFLALLTLQHAKEILKKSAATVADAALQAGLSGTGRLHDLFVTIEAMTPGEYKSLGSTLEIRYGFHPTPFGRALICVTRRGVCGLSFSDNDAEVLAYQKSRWPLSVFIHDVDETSRHIARIFSPRRSNGKSSSPGDSVNCVVAGTPFQCKVWEALLEIPPGSVSTYAHIAALAGHPTSVRATGNAVGLNPVAYLIPCHRVIRKSGALGGYRWGSVRKQAMLARETVL